MISYMIAVECKDENWNMHSHNTVLIVNSRTIDNEKNKYFIQNNKPQ